MLVAEKYGYLEEMEPVREPSRKEGPSREKQPRTAPAPKHSTLNKVMTIGMVMICFAAACFAVFRYTLISDNHDRILELENALEKEYVQQDKMKVELAGSEDLNSIEFTATAELGMQYPEEDQVQYVDLPEEPDKQAEAEHVDAGKASRPGKSIWNRLLGLSN